MFLQSEPGFTAEQMVAHADWLAKLTDLGYDVWIGGYAGDPTATGGSGSAQEKAQQGDWTKVGMQDVPSQIEQIRTLTGAEKVTYVGHSQGNASMFYGLAKREAEYFSHVLNRVVALAPCVFKQSRFNDWEAVATKSW